MPPRPSNGSSRSCTGPPTGSASATKACRSAMCRRPSGRRWTTTFGVPRALAVVHDQVRAGNAALAGVRRHGGAGTRVRGAGDGRGAGPGPLGRAVGRAAQDRRLVEATGRLLDGLLAERAQARAERDFARADEIREPAGRGRIRDRGHQGRAGLVGGRVRRAALTVGRPDSSAGSDRRPDAEPHHQAGGQDGRQFPAARRDAQAGHQEGRGRRQRRAVARRALRARARHRPRRRARDTRRRSGRAAAQQRSGRPVSPGRPPAHGGRAAGDRRRPQPGGRGAAGRGAGDRAVRGRRAWPSTNG